MCVLLPPPHWLLAAAPSHCASGGSSHTQGPGSPPDSPTPAHESVAALAPPSTAAAAADVPLADSCCASKCCSSWPGTMAAGTHWPGTAYRLPPTAYRRDKKTRFSSPLQTTCWPSRRCSSSPPAGGPPRWLHPHARPSINNAAWSCARTRPATPACPPRAGTTRCVASISSEAGSIANGACARCLLLHILPLACPRLHTARCTHTTASMRVGRAQQR